MIVKSRKFYKQEISNLEEILNSVFEDLYKLEQKKDDKLIGQGVILFG